MKQKLFYLLLAALVSLVASDSIPADGEALISDQNNLTLANQAGQDNIYKQGNNTASKTVTSDSPVTMSPATQAPATMTPATNAPASQAPVSQAPVSQAPVSQAPVTMAPVTIAPVTQAPVAIVPKTTTAPTVQDHCADTCFPLINDEGDPVGLVCVIKSVEHKLRVTYSLMIGYGLQNAHIWVGNDLTALPMTTALMPEVVKFPYSTYENTRPAKWTYDIPLVNLQINCWTTKDPTRIFAYSAVFHATVVKALDLTTTYAFATDDPLATSVASTSWWDLVQVSTACSCSTAAPVTEAPTAMPEEEAEECTTAYAYPGTKEFCFPDLGFPGVPGWTSKAILPSNNRLTFPLYLMDSATCDPSGLTSVGTVSTMYSNATGVALVQLTGDYYLKAVHFHYGRKRLPTDAQGKESIKFEDFEPSGQTSPTFKKGEQVHKIPLNIQSLQGDPIHVAATVKVCTSKASTKRELWTQEQTEGSSQGLRGMVH